MSMLISPIILLFLSACFALLSIGIWFVYLRPVPIQTAVGIIVGKHYEPATTYTRTEMTGGRTGFYTTTRIPIAECYVFEIQVKGWPKPARIALNMGTAEGFAVGQAVRINYQVRGLLGLWRRIYVLDMQPAEKSQ